MNRDDYDFGYSEHLADMRKQQRDEYYDMLAKEYPEEYARANAKKQPENQFTGLNFGAKADSSIPSPFQAEIDAWQKNPEMQQEYAEHLEATRDKERHIELMEQDFAESFTSQKTSSRPDMNNANNQVERLREVMNLDGEEFEDDGFDNK